jgi:hypothetical protein
MDSDYLAAWSFGAGATRAVSRTVSLAGAFVKKVRIAAMIKRAAEIT